MKIKQCSRLFLYRVLVHGKLLYFETIGLHLVDALIGCNTSALTLIKFDRCYAPGSCN